MSKTEKKINKRLVGLIIGSAIIGAGSLSMTPKGKSFLRRFLDRAQRWGEYLAGIKRPAFTKEGSQDSSGSTARDAPKDVSPHGAMLPKQTDQGDDADLVKE